MISIDGDSGRCGKGEAAESVSPSRGCSLGRDDNIGATVTDPRSVLRYWIFLIVRSRYLIVP